MKIPVVKYRHVWYFISAVAIAASLIAIGTWKLNQGIEFTGGTLMAVRFEEQPSVVEIHESLSRVEGDVGTAVVQLVDETDAQVRFKPITEDVHHAILSQLREDFGETEELRYDSIGPVIGEELRSKSLRGLLIVLLAILVYVAYAFRKVSAPVASWKYGMITIFAAFHDILIPLGVFAYLGRFHGVEIGTPFIAALLTILGYSITDTIVVMDRVRENLQKKSAAFSEIVQASIEQTFARSINTSVTTLLALVAIYLFGGETLKEFTLALIIGISVGTYSSVFIASPLLVTLERFGRKK